MVVDDLACCAANMLGDQPGPDLEGHEIEGWKSEPEAGLPLSGRQAEFGTENAGMIALAPVIAKSRLESHGRTPSCGSLQQVSGRLAGDARAGADPAFDIALG